LLLVSLFLYVQAVRSLKVPEPDLFETVDLFDGKDMALVIQCLHSLGSTLQTHHPSFPGPHLGVARATANKRNFTAEQLKAGDMVGTSLTLGNSSLAHQAANEKLSGKVSITPPRGNSPTRPVPTSAAAAEEPVIATVSAQLEKVNITNAAPAAQQPPPPPPPKVAKPVTVATPQPAAVTPTSADANGTRGCYLVSEEVSQGTMSLVWSETVPTQEGMV
jgi:hypothetical protein